MELHQLEAFSAVMSAGSITGAGRLLGRSQPGVTRTIQDLEQEIGYALFDRKGPRVTPTQRAFRLYEEVERSLIGLDAIRASARAIGRDEHAPLRVAATPALAAALVPRALARLVESARAAHAAHSAHAATLADGAIADHANDDPAAGVQLRSASAEQVVQALLSRAVDIGIATLPLDHAALDLHAIIEAPCVAVLHRDDPLTGGAVVRLQDLATRRIATVANRYRLRRRIDDTFANAGLVPVFSVETNASINAVMAAQAGLGIAIVDPATALGTRVVDVEIRPLDVAIPFFYGVVTLAGKPPNAAARALIDALERVSLDLLPGALSHATPLHDALLGRHGASDQSSPSDAADMSPFTTTEPSA